MERPHPLRSLSRRKRLGAQKCAYLESGTTRLSVQVVNISAHFVVLCALFLVPALEAMGQTVKITGLGAGTCKEFNQDIARNWQIQRDYFAWAQGYMSGLLMRAPPGLEDEMDLNPATFPLIKQVEFLRDFCARNVDGHYADGVETLYRNLAKKNRRENAALFLLLR